MTDKLQECAFVEKARRLYQWFPPGEITGSDAPDCRIDLGSERLGIEVARLFRPANRRDFPRNRWNIFNTAFSGGPTNSRRSRGFPLWMCWSTSEMMNQWSFLFRISAYPSDNWPRPAG
jgi:hypothetical protein